LQHARDRLPDPVLASQALRHSTLIDP